MSQFLSNVAVHYHWQAALIVLAGVVVVSRLGHFLAFKVPALQRMRDVNRKEDEKKQAKEKYAPVMRASRDVGLITNALFFVLILPFLLTLQLDSVWWVLLDSIMILMVYDFFYYLCHRFWFHGDGWMRKIHAVHHQARSPTYIDAYYVHPFETFVGIALFLVSIPLLAVLLGPFHVGSVIIAYVLFTQLNIINHIHIDLPYRPFRTLSWISKKHRVHHESMHKGNYATITLLYDKLFGTLD